MQSLHSIADYSGRVFTIWWPAVYQTYVNGCSIMFCMQTSEINHLNLYLRVTYLDSIQQYVAN